MPIIIIIAVLVAYSLIGSILDGLGSILTLDFLPKAYNFLKDSKIGTYSIPILGLLCNYVTWVFVNLVDFIAWLFHWIPGVGSIMDWIYKAPDMDLNSASLEIFRNTHRNFITHSVLNPVFVGFIGISYMIKRTIVDNIGGMMKDIFAKFILLVCACFAAHLLADTMPRSWQGSAIIKVKLFQAGFSLNSIFSQLWLYIHAIIALLAVERE